VSTWLPDGADRWGGRPVARSADRVRPRGRAVLTGVLGPVRVVRELVAPRPLRTAGLVPAGRGPWLEADLSDGTGTVTLRWWGRNAIAGVVEGAALVVEGTVLMDGARPVLVNPLYRFDHSSTSW
jgi:hypothetical protein